MKKVIIYSTPTCHYCDEAKVFFDKFKIEYESVDVLKSLEKRKEMMDKSGQLGVPVILVGKEVFVGFNYDIKNKIIELLKIKIN